MNYCNSAKFNSQNIKLVSFISFFLGFSQALLIYIMSSYFKEAFNTENVGVGYFIGHVCVLFILFNFHKIIKKIGKINAFIFTLLSKIILLSFLSVIEPSFIGAIFLIFYIILGAINWVSLDIILESFSSDHQAGRIRGLYLMMISIGFILGPIVSTQLLERLDFSFVFLLALCVDVAIIIFAAKKLQKINHNIHDHLSILKLFKKVKKRKNILRIYYISFILEFFYAVMIIYTPIYLRNLGVSWENIGLIFTFMLLPFILLSFPVGFLADKKYGEKEMLIVAILIMGFSVLGMYFINQTGILIWGVILFLTRVGASMVQILRDSYFYKRIDGQDVDIIDFYRTSVPMGYIGASLVTTLLLLIFPLNSLFLFLAAGIFSALYPAFRLMDSHVFSGTES